MLCELVPLIAGFSFKALHNCTNYFPCCDRILDRSNLNEQRFILTRFPSIMVGKAQQSLWQQEYVVEAPHFWMDWETGLGSGLL